MIVVSKLDILRHMKTSGYILYEVTVYPLLLNTTKYIVNL